MIKRDPSRSDVLRLVLFLVLVLSGCSSIRQASSPIPFDRVPEATRLTEELESLMSELLITPYTKRLDLLALFGEPSSTTTNSTRLLVDRHVPAEDLVLWTFWSASDPNDRDSLQWAEFILADEPTAGDRPWRFDKQPAPVPDMRVLRHKIVLLRRLRERLIRESRSVTHTDEFMDGDLTRTYIIKERFDLPVGQEIWKYQGECVAEGTYLDYRRWSGTFLQPIYNTETFRKIVYEDGVLLHSIIPDWEQVDGPDRFIDPFIRGAASDFSLDDSGVVANSNILSLAHEDGFLEWAAKHGVTEGYRVVVSPSFSPAIIFNVVLKCSNEKPSVQWIVIDGKAGYPDMMTRVASRSERRLSPHETRDIRRIVSRSLFWGNQKEHSVGACDGWSLDYEGIRKNQYTYRQYSNSDATASEALAHALLAMVPCQEVFRDLGQPMDSYMWNLHECTEDAIRLLEHSGYPGVVDELIFHTSAKALAHCIGKAKELATGESRTSILTGDFDALSWDTEGKLLVYPNGNHISAVSRKKVAGWDNSWMYDITLGNGAVTNVTVDVTVKFTPSATIDLYISKAVQPEPLSPTALKILRLLDLNPEFATVMDWGTWWAKNPADNVQQILVVPPANLAGAYSYTLTINHTERSYSVSRAGGIGGGGSLYRENFEDDW